MKVVRVASLLLLVFVAAAAYPCQPEKTIEYYSDSAFTDLLGWSWCSCQGLTYQEGQQSGAYRRITTVGCHIGQETVTCYQWTGSYWQVITCP